MISELKSRVQTMQPLMTNNRHWFRSIMNVMQPISCIFSSTKMRILLGGQCILVHGIFKCS